MTYRNAIPLIRERAERALIAGDYYRKGDYCAIGALLPPWLAKDVEPLSIANLWEKDRRVREALTALGLTLAEARDLQDYNDDFDATPGRRYLSVIEYLEAAVKKERP